MARQMQTFQAQPQDTQTVLIGATQYRVRLTWKTRTASWYLDLWLLDGTPVALGRRLSPCWGPLLGLPTENQPEEVIYISGPDEYERAFLGDSLQIRFYTQAEIDAAAPEVDDVSAVVVS